MFGALKLRFFISKVQTELMVQHRDQNFTNTVCQLPSNVEQLNVLREHAYYRKDKTAPFMAVCHVLSESMESDILDSLSRDNAKNQKKAARRPQNGLEQR